MTDKPFDVAAIGNAIVDVLAHADDSFLEAHGLPKGGMVLIDGAAADRLYDSMELGVECSGGSAANTAAGLASLGGRAAYIGKVADDALGRVFRRDIGAIGVHYDTPPLNNGTTTARCLILVTPDAQRTMNTYLGACVELRPEDIDPKIIRAAQVTYLEGYQWDAEHAKQAILKAADIAAGAGRKVALSLSDSFCVARHRAEFRALLKNHVDILFANEAEIISLYESTSFEESLVAVREHCQVAALTRGARGSVVVAGHDVHVIGAEPTVRVEDTTGAGDLYAAGFLYGYTRGLDLSVCARIGGIAAAEIISHFGARPETGLAALVADALGAAVTA
ncbi:MAG: adenosine kinase [Alphaproteobacteria bacterium]